MVLLRAPSVEPVTSVEVLHTSPGDRGYHVEIQRFTPEYLLRDTITPFLHSTKGVGLRRALILPRLFPMR